MADNRSTDELLDAAAAAVDETPADLLREYIDNQCDALALRAFLRRKIGEGG